MPVSFSTLASDRVSDPSNLDRTPPALRIGLMLRAVDEYDGAGVYIRKLCEALFELDRLNHYVAFYMRDEQLGRYSHLPNVEERVVHAPGNLIWDKVFITRAAAR